MLNEPLLAFLKAILVASICGNLDLHYPEIFVDIPSESQYLTAINETG